MPLILLSCLCEEGKIIRSVVSRFPRNPSRSYLYNYACNVVCVACPSYPSSMLRASLLFEMPFPFPMSRFQSNEAPVTPSCEICFCSSDYICQSYFNPASLPSFPHSPHANNRPEITNTKHSKPESPVSFPILAVLACVGGVDAVLETAPVALGVTYAKLVTVRPPTEPPLPGVGVPVATKIEVGIDTLVSMVMTEVLR